MLEKIIGFIKKSQEYAKAIVAGVGSLLVALTSLQAQLGLNLIPADWQPYITFGIAILTAYATWQVPNREPEA